MNGHHAVLSIQQTDEALTNLLWLECNKYGLVNKKVQLLYRINKLTGKKKKIVYYFQTLTFPFFTALYKDWYRIDQSEKVKKKVIPKNIEIYLTPLAIGHWTMGDGTYWKKSQRIVLCTDCFNLAEVNQLRAILLKKYTIDSSLKSGMNGKNMVHRIVISNENRKIFQKLISPYIIPSMLYKIGL